MTAHTCTVRYATTGVCGKPAVYTEVSAWSGETCCECAEHAAAHGSMASTAHMVGKTYGVPGIGDKVDVERHGKTYVGTVVRVTRGGKVFASVTYGNGVTRVVEAR